MTQPVFQQMGSPKMYSTPNPAFLQDPELLQLLSSPCAQCCAYCQYTMLPDLRSLKEVTVQLIAVLYA